jgi:hypothetical protein
MSMDKYSPAELLEPSRQFNECSSGNFPADTGGLASDKAVIASPLCVTEGRIR